MKYYLFTTAILIAALIWLILAPPSDELVIYSGRSKALVDTMIRDFQEQTGISVKVRYGGTTQLAVALMEEGARSPADLFWAQDAGALGAVEKEGLLVTLPTPLLESVPARFRNTAGTWVATSGRARVLAYSTTRANPSALATSTSASSSISDSDQASTSSPISASSPHSASSTLSSSSSSSAPTSSLVSTLTTISSSSPASASYPVSISALTSPSLRGRVGWAPSNGSFQAFITAMQVIKGDDFTREWLRAMRDNNTRIYNNNTAILQAIAAGEIDYGLTNHYYLLRALDEDSSFPVAQMFFAPGDAGNLINVAGIGLLKTSKKQDNARKFIEFLMSEHAQNFFTSEVHEYPVTSADEGSAAFMQLQQLLEVSPDVDLDALSDLESTLQLLREAGLL